MNPKVGIIMGSDSDLPVLSGAAKFLDQLEIPYELTVVSAHRMPKRPMKGASKSSLQAPVGPPICPA